MRKLAKKLAAKASSILPDAAGLAGAGLVSYGASLIYYPLGYIVGGSLLIAGVLYFSRPSAAEESDR